MFEMNSRRDLLLAMTSLLAGAASAQEAGGIAVEQAATARLSGLAQFPAVIGSIVAISAISLLRSFLKIVETADGSFNWRTRIVSYAFPVTSSSLTINDVTLSEGNAGTTNFSFTVNLSAVSGRDVSFSRATVDGTATVANNDYVALPAQTLSILAGQTSLSIPVTISIGVHASIPTEGPTAAESMIDRSDQALYQAKHQGRNRVVALA